MKTFSFKLTPGRSFCLLILVLWIAMGSEGQEFNGVDVEQSILSRNDVLSANAQNQQLCQAVVASVDGLSEFRERFADRGRSQDDFVVVVGMKKGSLIVPAGVLVSSCSNSEFFGTLIENALEESLGTQVTVSSESVIDWHYRDALELVGGRVYRFLLPQQKEVVRRTISDAVSFFIRIDSEVPSHVRRCYSLVANRRGPLLDADLKKCLALRDQKFVMAFALTDYNVRKKEISIAEYACVFGNADIIRSFHNSGLFNSQHNEYDPVYTSSASGNLEATAALLELGFDPNRKVLGTPPLIVATKRGHHEIARCLLRHGAKISDVDYRGQTALHYAESVPVARALVEAGADVNAVDGMGLTVLDRQLHRQIHDVINYLATGGAHYSTPPVPVPAELELTEDEAVEVIKEHLGESDDLQYFLEAEDVDFGRILPVRELGCIPIDND